MRALIRVKRCLSQVLEGAFELDPPPISVIPTHVEPSFVVLLYSRPQASTIHEYREIVSRLFEHSPEISCSYLELFLDGSPSVATG
jgi:hypothetical protein